MSMPFFAKRGEQRALQSAAGREYEVIVVGADTADTPQSAIDFSP
jgi:hypothetical protein